MSVEIEVIHPNKGYLDFTTFLNNEINNPSGGIHSQIVIDILDLIETSDYYGFISEIFTDSSTYYGCVFVDKDYRVLVIANGEVIFGNINTAQVQTLYTMTDTGLDTFTSASIPLFLKSGASSGGYSLENSGRVEFGEEVYYTNVKLNSNIVQSGKISAQTVENQTLGSYNIKLDKLPYDTIRLVSTRSNFTQFTIRVSENVVENFSYSYLGQILYVQDTTHSRENVRRLEREGVVSSNL